MLAMLCTKCGQVGTEKFKEMTGMAPPSQSTYAASTVGGLALMQGTAKVTTLLLVTAAVAYKVVRFLDNAWQLKSHGYG